MSLRMVVDGKLLEESVFEAAIDPADVRRLAVGQPPVGVVSLVVLRRYVPPLNGSLEFHSSGVRVLQIGETQKAFFILEESNAHGARDEAGPQVVPIEKPLAIGQSASDGRASSGYDLFLSRLPGSIRPAGEELIREVRRTYPGDLLQYEKSQRYHLSTDNFFTMKIQPRAGDIVITVRGNPWEFTVPQGLTVEPDRPSYSRFKMSRRDQVEGALKILAQAFNRGRR